MARYKWDNPAEWLSEKAQSWGEDALRAALNELARHVDFDDIQDIFQDEMDADGYFKELIDWREVQIYDEDGGQPDEETRISKLREYRDAGSMQDYFFNPDGDWGDEPEIDWTGFPEQANNPERSWRL